jgi:tetraacyldisaccharide 4'-kinase
VAILSILLFPFAFLYGLVTRFRNFLYDHGIKKSYSFTPAVISVGNLSVGGTGKTPMIEYLVNLLGDTYSLAILSRGYGRITRGFLMAEMHDDAQTIGDEPFQFYRKYGSKVSIAVCESRVEGINRLMKRKPGVQVVLLDDAFQHRSVRPLFSILLTDYSRPFFDDHLLPAGRLRESRRSALRADVLVVTKCPVISVELQAEFRSKIKLYAGEKTVLFSGIGYKEPVPMIAEGVTNKRVIVVTGIANSRRVVDYVSDHFDLVEHISFDDHHRYSAADVRSVQKRADSGVSIITTEKDFVKLVSPELNAVIDRKLWFYLPIEITFLNNGSEFDKLIHMKIEAHLKSLLT